MKPKSPEVYVQRSRFGKSRGAPAALIASEAEPEPSVTHLVVKLGELWGAKKTPMKQRTEGDSR